MKYLRLRGTPDQSETPRIFTVLADASFVEEARLVDWNLGGGDRPALLFSVDGNRERFEAALAGTSVPTDWDLTPTADGGFYLYLRLDPAPILERVLEVLTSEGLIVAKPVVYRDGTVRAQFVGEAEVLQAVLEAFPSAVDIDVRAVGEYGGGRTDPLGALSDRQRQALEAALELGYFEHPRAATQADVADRLECASSTASEHLKKAQAALVRAVLDDRRS